MSEFGSEIILIEPAPPLLQLECDNCVNGPLVANFGSSSPYENITCKLLPDSLFYLPTFCMDASSMWSKSVHWSIELDQFENLS